jgi:hypothetical protein
MVQAHGQMHELVIYQPCKISWTIHLNKNLPKCTSLFFTAVHGSLAEGEGPVLLTSLD